MRCERVQVALHLHGLAHVGTHDPEQRPVDLAGPIGPARKISTPGINLQPSIAFSPRFEAPIPEFSLSVPRVLH